MIDDLNRLYEKYNRESFIHPDPYEMVLRYEDKVDREVVGLIASSFAVGNVFQILKIIYKILSVMGDSPSNFLKDIDEDKLGDLYSGFYYRYYKDFHIIEFLIAIKGVLDEFGDIESWVNSLIDEDDEDYFPLFRRMSERFNLSSALIPKATGNSAFKRLALFFRWMVRKDAVDIGIWTTLDSAKLVVPLDIHMMSICKILGFTESSSNSRANALKITKAFRELDSSDPVKWDFALSRLGIHPDLSYQELIDLI